ncbi:hypothetical protein M011DRAFT_474232 [Sporormia fimetaria CBS 119925]|uniref:Uncharacterized protein n=1 Tax=Sporormia fimetaria CBS 119925 TaxID=1340428 RepID=A0A6A6VLQ3_9PLEO|nr:hypothetical protein M011DRAFT_474232 [Sporormia fimetaria CBS 119925]
MPDNIQTIAPQSLKSRAIHYITLALKYTIQVLVYVPCPIIPVLLVVTWIIDKVEEYCRPSTDRTPERALNPGPADDAWQEGRRVRAERERREYNRRWIESLGG